MSLGEDFARRLRKESAFLAERDRIKGICADFSREIERIYQDVILPQYSNVEGLKIGMSDQLYSCRLGEFRPETDFRAKYIHMAVHGRQLSLILNSPCLPQPKVLCVVGVAGEAPVDAEDPPLLHGRSVHSQPQKGFSCDGFDAEHFHKLMIEELVRRL